jgi:hypothetical protein
MFLPVFEAGEGLSVAVIVTGSNVVSCCEKIFKEKKINSATNDGFMM